MSEIDRSAAASPLQPPARVGTTPAVVLVVAAMVALALVPDEAVVRTKIVLGRGLVLVALGATLIAQAIAGRWTIPWPRFVAAASLPALVALVHAALAPPPSPVLADDEILRLALVPALVWCVGSSFDARARRGLLHAIAWGALLVCGYALAQNLAGVLALPVERLERASSTFGNPVFLGAWLVLVLPVTGTLALQADGTLRWVTAAATGLGLPALLTTASRGAWGGFVVAACLAIVLIAGGRRTWSTVKLASAALVALVALGFATLDLARPHAHGLIWRDSLAMFAAHPGGIGPGQFPLEFPAFASEELKAIYPPWQRIINDAHCEPIQLLVELGVPGLLAATIAAAALVLAGRRALAAVAGAAGQSFVSPDLRFVVSVVMIGVLLGLAASIAGPRHTRTIPLGRAGRLVALLAGIAGVGAATARTFEQLELTSLTRLVPEATAPTQMLDLEETYAATLARPDDPQAHLRHGRALVARRRFAEGAIAFRRALQLAPGNPLLIRDLGIAEALSGQLEPGLEHLHEALELDERNEDLRYLAALTAFRLGDIRTATLHVDRLLAQSPEHARGRVLRELLRE